jgi:hypothetical protein
MKFTLKDVAAAVALKFGIDMETFVGDARHRAVARPRQIAMFLARDYTTASYPQIGRFFGDRDHTTALHGRRRIAALVMSDQEIADDVAVCRAMIVGRGTWMGRQKASLERQRQAEAAEDAAGVSNDDTVHEVA